MQYSAILLYHFQKALKRHSTLLYQKSLLQPLIVPILYSTIHLQIKISYRLEYQYDCIPYSLTRVIMYHLTTWYHLHSYKDDICLNELILACATNMRRRKNYLVPHLLLQILSTTLRMPIHTLTIIIL